MQISLQWQQEGTENSAHHQKRKFQWKRRKVMDRNSVTARLIICLALWFSGVAHLNLVGQVENTPEGMLIYHGSAALVDLLLLVCMSSALKGRLVDDMEILCLVSIVTNSVGWILYMAYSSPIVYNNILLGVSCAQYLRLLLGDSYANYRTRTYLV